MKREQEQLLNQITTLITGDFEEDLNIIGKTLMMNFPLVRDDEFLQALEEELYDIYPEKQPQFRELFHRFDTESDEEFNSRMLRMVAEGKGHEARFEMEAYIRVMQEDFDSYHPKPCVKYLSIYTPLDYFNFKVNEKPGTQLIRTERDYPSVYLTYAKILLALNERKEAANAMQQAILWNPYDVDTIYDLTDLYQKMSQFGMSYATILNGLEYSLLPKNFARGFYHLGRFYANKGQEDVAYQFYQLSLSWQTHPRSKREVAKLLEEHPDLVKGAVEYDTQTFMKTYRVAGYPAPEVKEQLMEFADACFLLGQLDEALCYYRTYLDLYQSNNSHCEKRIMQIEKVQEMLAF